MSPIVRRPYVVVGGEDPGPPQPCPEIAQIPWHELIIGNVEDFSTMMYSNDPEPDWRASRIFLAEVMHAGRKVGAIYHLGAMSASDPYEMLSTINHSSEGMRKGSTFFNEYSWCLGLTINGHHFQSFNANFFHADPLEEYNCHPCEGSEDYLGYFDPEVFLNLTPEDFHRLNEGIKSLLELVRSRLGSHEDCENYCKGLDEYGVMLHRTKKEPEPLLRDLRLHLGSLGHAEFVLRNEVAFTLSTALTEEAPLTWLAVAKAAEAIGRPAPVISRKADGALIDIVGFRSLLDAYTRQFCPWSGDSVAVPKSSSNLIEENVKVGREDGASILPEFLRDSRTTFRFCMEFIVEDYADHDGYQGALSRPRTVRAQFRLVVPEDRNQRMSFEYQINEGVDYEDIFAASGCTPGKDEFLPRSRNLPVAGLEAIFDWLDEVNIWEWVPPPEVKLPDGCAEILVPPGVPWAPLVDMDIRYAHPDSSFDYYKNQWLLEVSRGGRCFRQVLNVVGAPAPSAFAFDGGELNLIRTQLVPVLANHLIFLNNDPVIVGLTKRLFRLLSKDKALPQVAKFDDGQGTSYEVDFERMVARRFTRNHGFGLGRLGILAPKLTEVPFTEYDRVRLWSVLIDLKNTHAGLTPFQPMDKVAVANVTLYRPGRSWSGDVCDGKRRWQFPVGRITADDEGLRQRFEDAFACLFSAVGGSNKGELPRLNLPKAKYVSGGVPPLALDRIERWFAPLYINTAEQRIQAYRQSNVWATRRDAWAGAMLGDVECMLKTGAECWYLEAANLGNPEAMVIFADRRLGLDRKRRAPSPKGDQDGLVRRYYEAAFKSGYMPAALGLGYVNQHGIGGAVDKVAAVMYYLRFLGDDRSSLNEDHLLAYAALADLYLDRHGPVSDLDEGSRYDALASAIIAQRQLASVQDEMKRCQESLDRKKGEHDVAMAKLTEASNFKRVFPRTLDSYEVGAIEDFSTFTWAGPADESEGVYLPLFLAELLYDGKAAGSISCINLSGVQSIDRPTAVHVNITGGGSAYQTTFIIHQSSVDRAFSDNFEVGTMDGGGAYTTKHRLYLGSREAVAGTPEWNRYWAIYRQLVALVYDRLGDPRDARHAARRRYVEHLKEAGLEPSPFIKDSVFKVGSVGHAEMLRRHELSKVLARTLARHEALSDVAISEAALVTSIKIPTLDRKSDGTLTRHAERELRSLAQAYLSKFFPAYWDLDDFMVQNAIPRPGAV